MFRFLRKKGKNRSLYQNSLSGDKSNCIRILTILPGIWADPIKCDLREAQLQDQGPYKALSYSWKTGEDDDRSCLISCNKVFIDVSCNLHSALRQLRHNRDIVKLWVDSICINQEDNNERTCQVGIMRDIYAGSTEVIIWLGESGPKDHLGEMILPMLDADEITSLYQWHGDRRDLPKLAAYVSKEVEDRRKTSAAQDSIDIFGAFYVLNALISGVEASGIQELRHLEKSGPILRGFDALMQPRWWSRAWVVQEVVVAQSATIRYGKLSAPWNIFSQAASQYEKARLEANADSTYPYLKEQSLARFSRMVLEIETTRNDWNQAEPVGLLSLLRKFRSRSSSDERDKVFALLGLVRFWRINEKKIMPDYHIDAIKVSFETTKSLLASVGSLSVLAGTLRYSECCDSNPSWVIDWNCPPTTNEDTRLFNLPWYCAGGNDGLVELHKQRTLKIEASYLDEVISVGEELVETTITRMRPVILDWIKLCAQFIDTRPSFEHAHYIGGGSVGDAFWRTICGDLEFVKMGVNTSSLAMATVKKGFRKATADGSLDFEQLRSADYSHRRTTSIIGGFWQESNEFDPKIARRNAFHHAVECASEGRKFFVTRTGYIGVGPRNMSIGDHAFILHGSQVPFILRSADRPVACQGDRIETLSSVTGSQQTYVPAGKHAKAPAQQKVCYETHSELYFVIGDAYVHGVMNGEELRPETQGFRKTTSICLI